MFGALTAWMERPDHPLLGPNVRFLAAVGLWPPHLSGPVFVLFRIIHVATLLFVVTQFAGLPELLPDLGLVVDHLAFSTASLLAVVKLFSFILRRDDWTELIHAIGDIETSQLRSSSAAEVSKFFSKYRRRARIVTYGFISICICTIIMIALSPLMLYLSSTEYRMCLRNGSIPYPRMFKSWFPMDVSRPPAYSVAIAIEVPIGFYGATVMGIWDALVMSVMIFFAGQLRLLRSQCAHVFGDECSPVSEEEARRRIVACHTHHRFLLKFGKKFNSLISTVMFIYFIECSIMLCAVLVQLTRGVDSVRLLWIIEYLWASFMQLFLFYWHSNEVYVESGETERGAWECLWYAKSGASADIEMAGDGGKRRAPRELLLLGIGLRRRIVFTAGPFNDMTLATFIAILKVSYSYFTLLRSTEQ